MSKKLFKIIMKVARPFCHQILIVLLTLFFPMFSFDSPENIRNPNISNPVIRTRTYACQGVRNVAFSDVFRGINKKHWEKKDYGTRATPRVFLRYFAKHQ